MDKDLKQLDAALRELEQAAPADDGAVYDCPLCRDSGYIIRGDTAWPCSCRQERLLSARRVAAGLGKRLQRMRFDNFDPAYFAADRAWQGKTYRELAESALRDARAFAAGRFEPGLLLEGDVGCGKTHLAAAMANQLAEQGTDVLFLVVPEFLDQLRATYRRDNDGPDDSEIIRRAAQATVLILDDMGAHNYTDWVRNTLFTIINSRYNAGLSCVVTTNLDLDAMNDNIGDRTTSRLLEMCRLHRLFIDRDARVSHNLAGRRV